MDIACFEACLAIGEVEVPDADEALVKSEGEDVFFSLEEVCAPSATGFGIVGPEVELVDDLEAGAVGLALELAWEGRQPPGKMYCWMKSVERL